MLARFIEPFGALVVLIAAFGCGAEREEEASCGRGRESAAPIFGGASELSYLQASESIADAVVRLRFALNDVEVECTGFFIDARWVVTAVHCAPPGSTGEVFMDSRSDRMSPPVGTHRLIQHPSLDVLLVELAGEVEGMIPIGLFNEDPSRFRGEKVQNAGFGVTEEGERGEQRFAVVILNEVGAEVLITSSVSGSGACEGDSGGPLLARDESGRVVALGVLTRGSAACNQADEYTRADLVREWILEFTGSLPDQIPSCDGITARGRCYANTSLWCDEAGELVGESCQRCGWDEHAKGFRCVEQDPCDGADDFGRCIGATTYEYCDGGHLMRVSCECDARCVVSSRTGRAYCASGASD